MNRTGPIILIEDDAEDVEIISESIRMLELPNPLTVFSTADGVKELLTDPQVQPLLVISDVNLPGKQGIDLYRELIAEPAFARKQVPYVFVSTSPEFAARASELSKCGYFVKPRNYFDYISVIQRIVLYWKHAMPQ